MYPFCAYLTVLRMGVILLHGAVRLLRDTCKHLAGRLVQNNYSVVGCCTDVASDGGRGNERRGPGDKISCPVKSSVRTACFSTVTTDGGIILLGNLRAHPA